MKRLFLFTFLSICLSPSIQAHDKAPNTTQPSAQVESDDRDGQVVLANVANMLGCIGMLSTDPYNPAVAGPSLAQIGISFINIIVQIFKSQGIDEEMTRACIYQWISNLTDEERMDIIRIFTRYADHARSQHYCPECECQMCTSTRLHNHGECR